MCLRIDGMKVRLTKTIVQEVEVSEQIGKHLIELGQSKDPRSQAWIAGWFGGIKEHITTEEIK